MSKLSRQGMRRKLVAAGFIPARSKQLVHESDVTAIAPDICALCELERDECECCETCGEPPRHCECSAPIDPAPPTPHEARTLHQERLQRYFDDNEAECRFGGRD